MYLQATYVLQLRGTERDGSLVGMEQTLWRIPPTE
jgi:hypothetical protein